MAKPPEEIWEEFESLVAIFEDEVRLKENGDFWEVSITISPATAATKVKQLVSINLVFRLTPSYPTTPPDLVFLKPVGLDDVDITALRNGIQKIFNDNLGVPMIYDGIEFARDFLTNTNVPRGLCPICLERFHQDDAITRTTCLHHFHSKCLGRYLEFRGKAGANYDCPVCRLPISADVPLLLLSPEPILSWDPSFLITDLDLHVHQWLPFLENQKRNGGLIDPNEEKFIVIDNRDPEDL